MRQFTDTISRLKIFVIIYKFPSLLTDAALWVKSKKSRLAVKKAQKALETVDNWSKKYGFLINPIKTQVVIFQLQCKLSPPEQDPHFPKLKLGNDILQYRESATFLGVTFDKYLEYAYRQTSYESDLRYKPP